MNRLTTLIAAALCLPLIAHADDASRRAKAKEMIVMVHTESMVDQTSQNIIKQVSEAAEKLAGPAPTPANKAKFAEFEIKLSKMVTDQMDWRAMEPSFIDFYANAFTEEQLDSILAFYRTPAGAALIEKMPTVNIKVNQLRESRLAILQPELRKLFEDFEKSQAQPVSSSPMPGPTPMPATAPSAPK